MQVLSASDLICFVRARTNCLTRAVSQTCRVDQTVSLCLAQLLILDLNPVRAELVVVLFHILQSKPLGWMFFANIGLNSFRVCRISLGLRAWLYWCIEKAGIWVFTNSMQQTYNFWRSSTLVVLYRSRF